MPNTLLYLCCPPSELSVTERSLRSCGFTPRWADTVDTAIAALEERNCAVLVDFADPGALSIVESLRRKRPGTFLLAVSDGARPGAMEEVERGSFPVVLHKPLDIRMLALLFANAAVPGATDGKPQAVKLPVFAQSPAMQAALDAARSAVASKGGVLVSGESGTGRTLLALEMHAQGERQDGPFVSVDCADRLGANLEASLFGTADSRDGSGAERRRVERITEDSQIARARRGTLFLAHVADMPTRVQARLARLLRDDEVVVGEERRSGPLDVRIIASGNLDWDAAVSEGRIWPDLARRLSVSRVQMPPLRDRRDDIPLLAAYLLRDACLAQRVPEKLFEPPALVLLTALPWRGNGRELRSLITTLATKVHGTAVTLDDVLSCVKLDGTPNGVVRRGTLREARARFERDYISAVLEHHRGRIGEAASELGIQRTNLYRKMRSLKLSWRTNGDHAPSE